MEKERDYGERKELWRKKGIMEKERSYGERKELWRKKGVMEEIDYFCTVNSVEVQTQTAASLTCCRF
ncbi:hypothetical protein ASJ81_12725 [Methanosarcina spelaei]|uniref:Uncharacterized protein n=1 Tax=Methanosarcina spelaei TaxID=1036679 RepID=A0A2A2HMJ3_9EURY|nr:hypothetical protein [Methanosarcina spelaei]PAV10627.1 hypothetical protein ASJ81_12725 [Methanosarcina spelaei]